MRTRILLLLIMLCQLSIWAAADEARAVWVTRGQYKSADDIRQIMENTAAMNLNIVLFQVRGNGTVFYKSKIEPWAWELTSSSPLTTGKDPGWDPLQVATAEAHKRRLKIHAWVNVFPGWRGQKYAPPEAGQLWTKHPDWFMVHKDGRKMIPRDKSVDPKFDTWYSFLNPAHPEVQEYIPKVIMELVRNYDIDGIHYDYVRYPGEIDDFSYDPVSLERFKRETGGTPDEKPQEWIEWRGKQVTKVVRDIYQQTTAVKPHVVVGGAVVANWERAKSRYFARSQEWLKDGILDVAMPMNYHHGQVFFDQTNDFVKGSGGRHVYIGISGNPAPDEAATKTPDTPSGPVTVLPMIVREIYYVREAGAQGVAVFSYGSLTRGAEISAQGKILLAGPFAEKAAIPAMPWKGK